MGLMAVGILLVSSCKKDDSEPIVYGNASVRIVNTVQGSSPQDLYQNDVMVSGSTVSYGNATAYLTVKAGPTSITLKNTGSSTVTATSNASLQTNDVFTIFFVSNGAGGTTMSGIPDDNNTITGKAKIRFVNLSTVFNNNVNVNLTSGASVVSGLSAYGVSAYQSIDPNLDLNVTVIGSTPVTIPGSNFVAGKNYTVWLDAANSTTANYHVIAQN